MQKETIKAITTIANTKTLSLREDGYYTAMIREKKEALKLQSERLTDRIRATEARRAVLFEQARLADEMNQAKIVLAELREDNKILRESLRIKREETKIAIVAVKAKPRTPHPLEQKGCDPYRV